MKRLRRYLLLGFSSALLGACSNQQTVNFSVVKESKQCRIQNAAVSSLSLKQDRANLIRSLAGFSDPQTSLKLQQLFENHLQTEDLYLVAQGQQASSGYSFAIEGNGGSLNNKRLTLPIRFISPAPESMTAQVMTSPCLVIGIESTARYEQLIVDELSLVISNN